MNINLKGFTLIELLVVIAIIGMLSSVVLSSLNTARGKAANAAVKSNLNNMRAQAEIYYDGNIVNGVNSYFLWCDSPTAQKMRSAARTAAGVSTDVCNSPNVGGWAASVALKVAENGNNYWCVDSGGASKGHPNALSAATSCP